MNILRKYIVLTLALLITLSASGVSISMHTCCGKLKDFSILGAAADCSMHAQPQTASKCGSKHAFNPKHKGKPCCSNQKIVVQKTDQATVQKSQVKEKASFDVLFVLTFVRSWLGYTALDDDRAEREPEASVSISQSLTILFRQFRI